MARIRRSISKKTQAFLAFGILVGGIMGPTWLRSQNETEESARLLSLGTPRPLKHEGAEKKVLLEDPSIAQNWGLFGTGGSSDIRATRAWEITQGSKDIVVAVIDTGLDVNHPDLKNNLWVNKGETGLDSRGRDKRFNGLDDDANGFVDDVNGYNFVSNNADLADNHGHGTHIAGIVGAEGGNGIGISGVAPRVSIMVLKYYDPKARGNDNLRNTIRSIQYAVKMKAHIINYSGGGTDYSEEEYQAVKMARDAGVLFVAAAGNERSNSDTHRYYPADYPLDNIVSVTAIDPKGEVLASSNYGIDTVHLAAPGEGIFSTLPGGRYGLMTGTSQATAFVSGVAALLKASNSELNYQRVRKQILATADEMPGLRAKTKTSGKLNSWAALAIQPSMPISGVVVRGTQPPIAAVTTNLAADPNLEAGGNATATRGIADILGRLRVPAERAN